MKTKAGITLPQIDFQLSIKKELIMRNYTFRLKPGQDLFDSISLFLQENQVQAGCILSGVGSLTNVALRFANQDSYANFDGYFEIVSITGTVSINGSHLHMSVSGEDGKTIGGHLDSGCKIYTTAEIVIAAFEDLIYKREYAEDSGYEELVVY
jgi:predicted DNA-binding protein with PD1-like motif